MKCIYQFPDLPPDQINYDSPFLLKALGNAKAALAELKGTAKTIPNQEILINTLILREAKASSEIENIVTTHDELFRASPDFDDLMSPHAKEVFRYARSLMSGYEKLMLANGVLSNNVIIEMFQNLKVRDEGFRNTPGTALRNDQTGEIVYVPPQDAAHINMLMNELEHFVNEEAGELDVLVKMAIIHHQFESIHPFSDGNGRIGRTLSVLYLTKMNLLDSPILYLSREINRTKSDYYRLLQHVRDTGEWEDWLIYILQAVEITSLEALGLIEQLRNLMVEYKNKIRTDHTKIYSQDLINNLFRHPYTRIEYVEHELGVSRPTATKYLNELAQSGILDKYRDGKNIYFINSRLVDILQN